MDSTIPSPSLMAFNRGTLFVLDKAIPRIVALEAATGALQWRAGRRGAGPGELAGVSAMFPDPDGGLGVVDIRNRRITRLTPIGEFSRSMSTANLGGQPNQACPFGRDRLIVADVFEPNLLVIDSMGVPTEKRPPIWPDLVSTDWQSRQVVLRSDGTGQMCLVGLSTGRGFALISPGQPPILGRYIESFDVHGTGSRIDEGEMRFWATYEAGVVGDTVLILFSGVTPERARIVDRYSATSGEYLGSDLLPFPTSRIAAGEGLLFAVDTSRGSIVALRARP
jgi:hypothetical protein